MLNQLGHAGIPRSFLISAFPSGPRGIWRGLVRKPVGESGRQRNYMIGSCWQPFTNEVDIVLISYCHVTNYPKHSGIKTTAILLCCQICGWAQWGWLISAQWGPGTLLQWLGQPEFPAYVTRTLALAFGGVSTLFNVVSAGQIWDLGQLEQLGLPGCLFLSLHDLSIWLIWVSSQHGSLRVGGLLPWYPSKRIKWELLYQPQNFQRSLSSTFYRLSKPLRSVQMIRLYKSPAFST